LRHLRRHGRGRRPNHLGQDGGDGRGRGYRLEGAVQVGRSRGLPYKWVVLINTTVGVVMSSLDGSILTISLPQITRSINASVVEVMWTVMGYSLVTTSLILPISRLADMKGRVKLYNLGFAVFTVASGLCGFAQTGAQLVVFRLIQ